MNHQVTWTPCSNLSPQRFLCPYFDQDSNGVTSITLRRTTMTGGILIENLSTLETVTSTTLTSIDPGSDIALPSFPTGSSIYITGCDALTTVNFPNLASIGESLVIACQNITSINFDSLQTAGEWCDDPLGGFYQFNIYSGVLTSLSLPAFVGFADLSFVPYAEIRIEGCPALTSISMPSFLPNNGIVVSFAGNALDQASVDHLLARAVANPAFVSGTYALGGGTNATPSAGGLADKATLIGRGVTVTTN